MDDLCRLANASSSNSLDGAHLEVTSSTPVAPNTGALPSGADADTPIGASSATHAESSHLEQEDKPKAGIMAECTYLATDFLIVSG